MSVPGPLQARQTLRKAALLLLLLLGVAGLSCSEDEGDGLEGSLEAHYDLGFDRIRVLLIEETLAVEYLREVSGGTQTPFKLIAEQATGDRKTWGTAELSVSRFVGDASSLPALEFGELRTSAPPQVGERLSGDFDLRFVDGSDLSGRFEAEVEGLNE